MKEPLLQTYSPNPTPFLANLVACTGSQFCGMAIAETKARSLQLVKELDETMECSRPLRLHFTGCPNTCAQVQVDALFFFHLAESFLYNLGIERCEMKPVIWHPDVCCRVYFA
jgi:sulfite reductase beta subunit-like hemoprotein